MSDSSEQRDTLGALIRDLYFEFRRGLQREMEPRNVSLPQWTLLRILWREDGLTQKELSERVGNHPSTTMDALRTMEGGGLVKRQPDPKDGRAIRVLLTRKGYALQAVLMPCAEHMNDLAVAGMTKKEIVLLRTLLMRMLSNLERTAR